MVDFSKRLGKSNGHKKLHPVEIYDTLDRASDKGPLRPAQEAILNDWHAKHRAARDVIVKLHTGQGKTLIGLLILQSKLNEQGGPIVYLCPNNFLINQTCLQARQFGVPVCVADGDLPDEFIDGKAILVTSVHKLFNGLTKFKTGNRSLPVTTLLMDDAHACVDAIRDAFVIRLPRAEPGYGQLLDLFADSLEAQGAGDYADVRNGSPTALLPLPYWDWRERHGEVVNLLGKQADREAVKFAWPVLKNRLAACQCIVSGESLEIAPYLPPLDLFGSYWNARHRVFMSATVTDDSFLVKGLRLSPDTIRKPLVYEKERWSGEKMVLIPQLISGELDRDAVVGEFARVKPGRRHGVVALAPSFRLAKGWEERGARVAKKETIDADVERLRGGQRDAALVIVSRYDGIDLPDDVCRVLVLDSKPHADSLVDRYSEVCRASSLVNAIRTARTIEQGMGRSVRGEKDFCVVVLTGTDLVKTVRTQASRKHLSNQTRTQVEIGLEIVKMAQGEIEGGAPAMDVLNGLVNQCLRRDADWKQFYTETMDRVEPGAAGGAILDVFQHELDAEIEYAAGRPDGAVKSLQRLIDQHVKEPADRGWYLQEMARYTYGSDRVESNRLQLEAHRINGFLMKPRDGFAVTQLQAVAQRRVERVIAYIRSFETYEDLLLTVDDMLACLAFGVKADRFEQGFDELGEALGFRAERPDKQWKQGPDNLWAVRDGEYLLVEAKNEVGLDRPEMNKEETGQMNNACAWFARHYPGAKSVNVMVHPASRFNKAAGFNKDVLVMRKKELGKLTKAVRAFFTQLRGADFGNLSESRVQALLDQHKLSVDSLCSEYAVAPQPA